MTHPTPRPPKPPGLRATARELGITLSSLQEARDSGRITWPPVSVEALRAEYLANTREEYAANPLAARGQPSAPAAPAADGESRQEALRRKAIAEADLREIELALKQGELVRVEDVKREWIGMLSAARGKLLALPSRLRIETPEIGARGFVAATEVVHQVLTELSEDS